MRVGSIITFPTFPHTLPVLIDRFVVLYVLSLLALPLLPPLVCSSPYWSARLPTRHWSACLPTHHFSARLPTRHVSASSPSRRPSACARYALSLCLLSRLTARLISLEVSSKRHVNEKVRKGKGKKVNAPRGRGRVWACVCWCGGGQAGGQAGRQAGGTGTWIVVRGRALARKTALMWCPAGPGRCAPVCRERTTAPMRP